MNSLSAPIKFFKSLFFTIAFIASGVQLFASDSVHTSQAEQHNSTIIDLKSNFSVNAHLFNADSEEVHFHLFLFECLIETNEIQESDGHSLLSNDLHSSLFELVNPFSCINSTGIRYLKQQKFLAQPIDLFVLYCNWKNALLV